MPVTRAASPGKESAGAFLRNALEYIVPCAARRASAPWVLVWIWFARSDGCMPSMLQTVVILRQC